ncbi:anti-anti-sigma factor [Chloroflexus islandicus]|uniref:Anti-anti-sigma factor n=1 Tax=Chloroflexus islandicus TaxID=1707952 RepID=A0A178MDN4_9CHLR|nr:histidine kinase N-terminal 7TM domain-containing protein [Chloroflexus islandicus]OAN46247.1 anti-anti-sigma factor [Chloroflexus islandicus]
MELLLVLFTLIILAASIVYVLLQDWRAQANRIFALFTGCSLVLTCAGAVRFASRNADEIWLLSGLLTSLLAAIFGFLVWLIMILFMPHRYRQPVVRWAAITPYAFMTVFLAIDWYGRFGIVGGDVFRAETGVLSFVRGPLFWPVFALYIIGCLLAPLAMLGTVAIRHPALRTPALWLTAGAVATFLMGYVFRELGLVAVTYISLLPLHLSFGWVTLRYGVFRPSQVALQAAVENLPDGVLILDASRRVRFANRAAQRLIPAYAENGRTFEQTLVENGVHEQTTAEDQERGRRRFVRAADGTIVLASEVAISDEQGTSSVVLLRDVTRSERQQAELLASRAVLAERTAELERSLAELQQRDTLLRRLTLPIIPLSETVLLVPLIGVFDADRCQTLVDLILPEIAERNARTVLVDLTGLTVFEQDLARTLRQLSDGARLMGAQVALCGIRPDMAEVMIHTGSTWNGMRSFATLQAGVKALLAKAAVMGA